ncbi:MAG: thiol:disulfide interchange protein DsbA/DsbL [Formosimonas sp.]
MFKINRKISWAGALAALFLLSACEKEAAKPAASTVPVAANASAEPVKTYSAADFKTDGLTITEGKDYQKVATPQPVQVAGKIEVLEFFWYGCPHCNAIEPITQAWKKNIPADVSFIRAHPSWGPHMDVHQKTYYALSALKKNDLDEKIFNAIHKDGLGLNKPETVAEFMAKNGIDKAAWDTAYNSFSVNTEVAKANGLFQAYGLKGVPYFIVNGKYVVGGESTHTLQVVNKLIEQERGQK